MKIVKPSVKLLWITENPEYQIEVAGRTCYKSEDRITGDSSAKFAKHMTDVGHHAMIEHACASFKIVTDRGISHEIVRHRIASFAQESSRYCNYSKDKFDNQCSFIMPPDIDGTYAYEIWYNACEEAEKKYFEMLNYVKPEIARAVLPTCTKTEIVMTANFREFRHFIKLRSSKAAHPQIRPIAKEICNILCEYSPSIFTDLKMELKNV